MGDWSLVVPHAEAVRSSGLHLAAPHPALAGEVLGYSGREQVLDAPLRWRPAVLGAVTVTLDLETPSRMLLDEEGANPHPRDPVLGLRSRPLALAEEPGLVRTLTVGLSPAAAYALLGVPLGELPPDGVALERLLGRHATLLTEQVAEAATWRRRFALVDRFLTARLPHGPRPAPEVEHAWQRLSGHRRRRSRTSAVTPTRRISPGTSGR
ncbi:hypothetical protein GCM10023214_52380 [Amycolatopsis dongchuanensis]|uniref:Uncharacterized protein n=1 Tax=Amycolatopsis dongchuanensis TaxID=1070866 RepID=A0ABP9R4U8_9PSEU